MADLQAMFQNIGPTSASLMNGIQMGQQYNANESEQAMRQAQMDKVLQDTKQAELMNPLLVQGKQQELKTAQLKAQADEHAYHTQVLGDIIPQLEKVPNGPGQRLAYLQDCASKRGVPLNETELQQFAQDPDVLKSLKSMHQWGITENEKYRQAMDVALTNERSHKYSSDKSLAGVKYSADARANTLAAKNKGIATIEDEVKSGKMTAEKAAVAMFGAAQFETDPTEKQRLENMARQYELFAMNQRNASASGKVDVGAAANLPTQTLPPALGTNPSATPASGGHTFADVQKMYPNVGADQLRKAYKDKFGVDLK